MIPLRSLSSNTTELGSVRHDRSPGLSDNLPPYKIASHHISPEKPQACCLNTFHRVSVRESSHLDPNNCNDGNACFLQCPLL